MISWEALSLIKDLGDVQQADVPQRRAHNTVYDNAQKQEENVGNDDGRTKYKSKKAVKIHEQGRKKRLYW